jgi:choline dehydrogenase
MLMHTIGTPMLLMLSGIGDYSELRSLGINALANSPNVGKNLQVCAKVAANQLKS